MRSSTDGAASLWWLAPLLLDLTIVWHSQVRWSGAIKSMRNLTHPGWNSPEKGAHGGRG